MNIADDRDDDFLIAACQAMSSDAGGDSLGALGWWDLLSELGDVDARTAVFAAFRAQGRELADSPALGALLAQPFVEHASLEPGSVCAAIPRRSASRGPVWVLVGNVGERDVLFDVPGTGVYLIAHADVSSTSIEVPGRLTVNEVAIDLPSRQPLLAEPVAAELRATSWYLGRLAAAAEILGSAETAVRIAVEYAALREQFGQPIGGFQAVRHILAWASTDCMASDSVIRRGLEMLEDPPERYGEVVKALAGRNGRKASERSLQVLGGIGFTAEHVHHHHHSRVLLLDALLGSSAELSHELGGWLRTSGADPGFPAAVVAVGAG